MSADAITQPPIQGFVRLSGPSAEVVKTLGPLADLLGTWVGSQGWNMIAVPINVNDKENFQLEIMQVNETITFSPIGAAVPNKGFPQPTFIFGLQYELRVCDLQTSQPLHIENGMWLLLDQNAQPGAPGTIARQAAIPHGDSLLALGSYSTTDGPPQIPDINAVPDPGPDAPLGYTDPWTIPLAGFSKVNPNQVLQDFILDQEIIQTTTLDVSTENNGGIVNIPFLTHNVHPSAFQSTFWIEKVVDQATGQVFEQLQYSQQTNLHFIHKFGAPGLIMWPHVNINTLVKQ